MRNFLIVQKLMAYMQLVTTTDRGHRLAAQSRRVAAV